MNDLNDKCPWPHVVTSPICVYDRDSYDKYQTGEYEVPKWCICGAALVYDKPVVICLVERGEMTGDMQIEIEYPLARIQQDILHESDEEFDRLRKEPESVSCISGEVVVREATKEEQLKALDNLIEKVGQEDSPAMRAGRALGEDMWRQISRAREGSHKRQEQWLDAMKAANPEGEAMKDENPQSKKRVLRKPSYQGVQRVADAYNKHSGPKQGVVGEIEAQRWSEDMEQVKRSAELTRFGNEGESYEEMMERRRDEAPVLWKDRLMLAIDQIRECARSAEPSEAARLAYYDAEQILRGVFGLDLEFGTDEGWPPPRKEIDVEDKKIFDKIFEEISNEEAASDDDQLGALEKMEDK